MTNEQIVYDALVKHIREYGSAPQTAWLVDDTKLTQYNVSMAVRSLSKTGVIRMQYRSYKSIQIVKDFPEKVRQHHAPIRKHGETRLAIRRIIQQHVDEGRPVPSCYEIGKMVGVARRSAGNHIESLVRSGVISMKPRRYDTIKIRRALVLRGHDVSRAKPAVISSSKPVTTEIKNKDIVFVLTARRNELVSERAFAMHTVARLDKLVEVIDDTFKKLAEI